jgi:uncharacterized CHY-type Zn-finger protein
MPRTLLKCYICGENLDHAPINPQFEVCRSCLGDAVLCPRCNRFRPRTAMRGSYCQPCRSEYNRLYNLRRRGLA